MTEECWSLLISLAKRVGAFFFLGIQNPDKFPCDHKNTGGGLILGLSNLIVSL